MYLSTVIATVIHEEVAEKALVIGNRTYASYRPDAIIEERSLEKHRKGASGTAVKLTPNDDTQRALKNFFIDGAILTTGFFLKKTIKPIKLTATPHKQIGSKVKRYPNCSDFE